MASEASIANKILLASLSSMRTQPSWSPGIPGLSTHTQAALEQLIRVDQFETRMGGETLIQGPILAEWNEVDRIRDEIIDILDQAGLDFEYPDITLSMQYPYDRTAGAYITIRLKPSLTAAQGAVTVTLP